MSDEINVRETAFFYPFNDLKNERTCNFLIDLTAELQKTSKYFIEITYRSLNFTIILTITVQTPSSLEQKKILDAYFFFAKKHPLTKFQNILLQNKS